MKLDAQINIINVIIPIQTYSNISYQNLLLNIFPYYTEKQTAGGPPGLRLSEDDCKGAAANLLASRANIFSTIARKTPRRHQLHRYLQSHSTTFSDLL